MPYTVPNQRTVKIHRETVKSDFLGIKNHNWQSAACDLGAHALMLYLYLASNADNYELALSPAAIAEAIGMPRSTYHDQFKKLENRGYIKFLHGNTYEFFETPQPRSDTQEKEMNEMSSDVLIFENNPSDDIPNTFAAQDISENSIEINNIKNSTNKRVINNSNSNRHEELYPTVEVRISSPTATGRNRPKAISHNKEFTF